MKSNRTIVVTGSSRGIGRAIRNRLVGDGHRVLGISRQPAPKREGDISIPLDLSKLDSLSETLREAVTPYPELDAVVSNAGGPAFGNLEQLSPRQIRDHIDLNLTSHLLVVRTLLPMLKRHPHSDLVIIGSEASRRGGKRGSIYCAAKFGLRGFAQSLREECASGGVRVTIINPGMVRTSFFDGLSFAPGERDDNVVDPEDVADAVQLVLAARWGTVFDEIDLSPLRRVVRTRNVEKDATEGERTGE